ncbi:MAG: dTDP-4-dehydrorhamnose 3,5-epimerase family protein [Nitrospirae bacterium]|nr:dTDP-4-dehydrorhamnose 3,5-epimerase family protein [Nitrospirota bacterium]MBF0554107.1 dTDP-4-dehydrorhamnose 3,5-epimerase family protein [Nitrospirota bacterium]
MDGLIITPLTQITDDRGKVMHMLRADSPLFKQFGEVYFSVVYPRAVKAWKKHLSMTQNLAVPIGCIQMVIYDDREDSSHRGQIKEIEIGDDNYALLTIPPLVWYGFKAISNTAALITNCADIPHDQTEVIRLPKETSLIPYRW